MYVFLLVTAGLKAHCPLSTTGSPLSAFFVMLNSDRKKGTWGHIERHELHREEYIYVDKTNVIRLVFILATAGL